MAALHRTVSASFLLLFLLRYFCDEISLKKAVFIELERVKGSNPRLLFTIVFVERTLAEARLIPPIEPRNRSARLRARPVPFVSSNVKAFNNSLCRTVAESRQ